eukprot:scaffold1857_cov96-Skeletonema_dohrnii-CCMP3373.AAC.3
MASNNNTKIIIVPTKQHDGGGNSDMTNLAIAAPQPQLDAFTKYSSNLIRMKELLLLGDNNEQDEEEDDLDYLSSLNKALRYASISDRGQQIDRNNHNHGHDDASASKRRKGNNSYPIVQQGGFLERKTRVSFELHPSLLLHDLVDLDVDVSTHISDDEDDDQEQEE